MTEMTADEISRLLANARIGRVGMADISGNPYVIPMPFCWVDEVLYMRLPMKGRKGEILRLNPKVCFEVDEFTDDLAEYASVLIEGRLEPVTDLDEKARVREVNSAKYLRLRGGFRPGHGRATMDAALPLQKIVMATVSGRKKAPAAVAALV
jgi:nitroimidazol reductase NimA-like FMN-containing flavoprotein (pyridoxamine 5'-phosphate oxidase superfamily)